MDEVNGDQNHGNPNELYTRPLNTLVDHTPDTEILQIVGN